MERGNLGVDANGEVISGPNTRTRVRMRHPGADYLVVVMKRSNVRGAKGVGHPVVTFKWANWKQEELAGCGGGRQRSQGWHEPCDGRLSCTDL
jgi:hypothetical protein